MAVHFNEKVSEDVVEKKKEEVVELTTYELAEKATQEDGLCSFLMGVIKDKRNRLILQ